jgi:two-component system, response regulator FlrC
MEDLRKKAMRETLIFPVAVDPKSKATLEVAQKAAKSSATLLLNGETGVGKELIAHYIHQHSAVSDGPFISINCAALPENMIEAILFGYEKGAFTNAINTYIGKFEQAHNGTLLLDEISEIPLALQAKLLRVLQEKEVERLGGKGIIKINARIIAATNRNLYELVKEGSFRSDLYYRLSVIPLYCGALRERPLDIIPLADYFIEKHANLLGREIPLLTHAAKRKLQSYPWPGNVREMENVIQRTLVMTNETEISDTQIILTDDVSSEQDFLVIESKLKANEAKIIIDALKETAGCRGVAAKKLNMSPRTLRHKISKLKSMGIKIP